MEDSVTVKPNSVAVLGFHEGNAGQTEPWFEQATGYHIACFVHEASEPLDIDAEAENRKRVSQRMEYPTSNSFKGRPLIVSLDWIEQLKMLGIRKVLPLTSWNEVRFAQIEACRNYGFELVSAIHPSATILSGATIEPGVWINAGSIIGYKAEIEAGVFLNTGAQVDHHNVLRRCCSLDPGVVTAGNVTIGERCYIHTGAKIIDRIQIGDDAIIGAGAVVIRDTPPKCTAVGVPAKVIKYH